VRGEGWDEETLLVYLCLHAAAHRYRGLCHMCDLDALLRTTGEEVDWKRAVRVSREMDIGFSVGLALGLLAELAPHTELSPALEQLSHRRQRLLRAIAGPRALDVVNGKESMSGFRRAAISLTGATPRGACRFLWGAIAPPGSDLEAFRRPGEEVGLVRLYGRRLRERLSRSGSGWSAAGARATLADDRPNSTDRR
jgi:hypothetical protein